MYNFVYMHWDIIKALGAAALLVIVILILLLMLQRGSTPAIADGGGDPGVSAVYLRSPGTLYNVNQAAWIVPTSDVGSVEYTADFVNLIDLNKSNDIVFLFYPDDILCDDNNRLSKGGSYKNRVIYRGQVEDMIISRGNEIMGIDCPLNTPHVLTVYLLVNNQEIDSKSVNFCLNSCGLEPTPTREPVPTFTPEPEPTIEPTTTPYPTLVPPPTVTPYPTDFVPDWYETVTPTPEPTALYQVPDYGTWQIDRGNFQVCENGHCITDHIPDTPIHICGVESEDGYQLRWAGAYGDNAGPQIPDVAYMMSYESASAGMPIIAEVWRGTHGHTGAEVVVLYTKKDNKLRIVYGSTTFIVDVNHNVMVQYN